MYQILHKKKYKIFKIFVNHVETLSITKINKIFEIFLEKHICISVLHLFNDIGLGFFMSLDPNDL